MSAYPTHRMAPRRVFVILVFCTMLSPLSLQVLWAAGHQRRPNIVLVFIDDKY